MKPQYRKIATAIAELAKSEPDGFILGMDGWCVSIPPGFALVRTLQEGDCLLARQEGESISAQRVRDWMWSKRASPHWRTLKAVVWVAKLSETQEIMVGLGVVSSEEQAFKIAGLFPDAVLVGASRG